MFPRPRPRGIAAIAIIAAWTASLVWLGVRNFGRQDGEALSGQASLRIAPGDAWLAVMAGDVQVGTVGITLDTLSPGFRIQESATMEIPQEGGLMHSARFTKILVGPTLALQSMSSSWSRPGRRTLVSLGDVDDHLMAHFEPGPIRQPFPSDEPLSLLHVFPYQLALSKGMSPGRHLGIVLMEGWPTSARGTDVVIGRDTMVTYPDSVVVDQAQGTWRAITRLSAPGVVMTVDGVAGPYRIITDKRGRLQGLETLVGVRWVRENFDVAMNAFQALLPRQIENIRAAYPTLRALTASPTMPDSITERRFLVAHRDGTPVARDLLALLAGGRQRIAGDTLIIAEASTRGPRDTLLASIDPLTQFEMPLAEAVKQIIPNPRAPEAISRLIAWLGERVVVDTAATAAEDAEKAMALGRARPDGLVRLFIAMARSVGIQARYVVGVRPAGETLYTHAWAEVRDLGGAWVAVDPAQHQVRASTSLIRLAWGGSSYPEDMYMLLANARFIPVTTGHTP